MESVGYPRRTHPARKNLEEIPREQLERRHQQPTQGLFRLGPQSQRSERRVGAIIPIATTASIDDLTPIFAAACVRRPPAGTFFKNGPMIPPSFPQHLLSEPEAEKIMSV